MSIYRDSLAAARAKAREAHDAMEAWLNRPLDAPDVPAAVLERHAAELRASREHLRELLSEHGKRDDIDAALEENETLHKNLGLSIRDKVEAEEDPGAEG
jgi:hypothetical protein